MAVTSTVDNIKTLMGRTNHQRTSDDERALQEKEAFLEEERRQLAAEDRAKAASEQMLRAQEQRAKDQASRNQAPPPIAIPAGDGPMDFPPESEQPVGMNEAGLPKKIKNTNADPRRLATDAAARIRAKRNEGISGDPSATLAADDGGLTVSEATKNRAIAMENAGLGDASVGGPQLKSVTDGKPDDMPTSEPARQDAADAMQEQDDQKASAEAATASAQGSAVDEAYENYINSLIASGQKKMFDYYTNPEPMSYDEDTGTRVPDPDGKTGKQLFIEDVLESDQNSPEEQQSAMGDISRSQDRRFANKVPDFDETTGNRPGAGRNATNAARGTREFERRLNQEGIPEKLKDPDKNMVPTNMFDPETGEPGIAGQSPTMVGEGMPEREGASAIYGPPGTDWKRRGMEMGDQHGPNGSGDGDANYMLSLMTEENWNGLRDQDRRDLVMNLANRLGYLDGIKNLPEDEQYYAAKRAVFTHLFQTGDGATRIWANNEAELGENSDLIDPNKKPMLVNEWDDNRQQWVLNQSQDSRDRARMRSATAFASRGMKGHSQIDQYMNPDGTMNEEAAGAKMLEVINRERVNMGEEPVSSVDELNENERLAYDQGMRLLGDMPQYARVKQNNMDQGRGQMMMGHAGNSIQWRQLGAYNRELDAAETLEEKAAIARKYNNRADMMRFDEGANSQADRDAAAEAAALEKAERDENINRAITEADKQRASDEKIAEINAAAGQETSPGYTDQLRASEGDPVMMQYAHEEELKKQLQSMANEDGTVTWDQIRQNNAAIAVLNNMYLDPKMGRSWTEWWNDEEMGEVQQKKFVVGQKAYVDSVLDMLGLNVPGREEELEAARAWAEDNYIKKFRAVNPMGAHALRLDKAPTPPAKGQGTAQETQEQETQEPTTNGKPVEGPQEDSLPDIPPGNAPGTRARRRGKKSTGSSFQFRVPWESNPDYSPSK